MDTATLNRPDQPHTAPIDIGAVTLAVRDIDRVAQFYIDVIGLELIERSGDEMWLGAGGAAFLHLQHRPDLLPRDPAAAGLFHTAFLLPSRADLGRWLRHITEIGVTLDGAADHLVSEAVYLHDPEGNGIEVYADRPRTSWTWEGNQVLMANSRLDSPGLLALATERWAGAPSGTRIGHVHLQVGQTDTAERFYSRLLGFEVTRRWPQAVFMSTGGYHHHLAANTWNSARAGQRDPARAGLHAVTLHAQAPTIMHQIAERNGGADPVSGIPDPWGTLIRFTTAA